MNLVYYSVTVNNWMNSVINCSNILFVEADFTLQWNWEEYDNTYNKARIQQAHYNMLHTDVAL